MLQTRSLPLEACRLLFHSLALSPLPYTRGVAPLRSPLVFGRVSPLCLPVCICVCLGLGDWAQQCAALSLTHPGKIGRRFRRYHDCNLGCFLPIDHIARPWLRAAGPPPSFTPYYALGSAFIGMTNALGYAPPSARHLQMLARPCWNTLGASETSARRPYTLACLLDPMRKPLSIGICPFGACRHDHKSER